MTTAGLAGVVFGMTEPVRFQFPGVSPLAVKVQVFSRFMSRTPSLLPVLTCTVAVMAMLSQSFGAGAEPTSAGTATEDGKALRGRLLAGVPLLIPTPASLGMEPVTVSMPGLQTDWLGTGAQTW